jgi:hypothetical protein
MKASVMYVVPKYRETKSGRFEQYAIVALDKKDKDGCTRYVYVKIYVNDILDMDYRKTVNVWYNSQRRSWYGIVDGMATN